MIYLAISPTDNKHQIQHDSAYALLNSLLEALDYKNAKIRYSDNGRPYCDIKGLDFSISHTGNVAAVCVLSDRYADVDCVFSLPIDGSNIGLDVEEISTRFDLKRQNGLAKRFLGTEISSPREFYRLWTRNEAYGKMTGEGVINKKEIDCSYLSFELDIADKLYSLSIAIH